MRKYIYILLIFIFVYKADAQKQDSLNYDHNSPIDVRTSEKINDYLNDDYYLYDQELVKPPINLLQRILKWIGDIFRFIERGGKPVSYIFYVIMFAILLFVIIKILGLNYQSLFIRSSKIKGHDIDVFDEDIHAIDFDAVIDEAVKNENYRKAVRYLYIKFLKVLTDNELIEWEINKTNKDYRKEMRQSKYFSIFKNLTFVYEYVWYGEFAINYKQFTNFYSGFNQVYKDFK